MKGYDWGAAVTPGHAGMSGDCVGEVKPFLQDVWRSQTGFYFLSMRVKYLSNHKSERQTDNANEERGIRNPRNRLPKSQKLGLERPMNDLQG